MSCCGFHRSGECDGGGGITTVTAGNSLIEVTEVSADEVSLAVLNRENIGVWRAQNLAANTNTRLGRLGASASSINYSAPRDGQITAITCSLDAVVPAGPGSALVIQILINGVAVTGASSILTVPVGGQFVTQILAAPIAVLANDEIGVRAVTDAAWTGTAIDPDVDFELEIGGT